MTRSDRERTGRWSRRQSEPAEHRELIVPREQRRWWAVLALVRNPYAGCAREDTIAAVLGVGVVDRAGQPVKRHEVRTFRHPCALQH